MKRLQGCIRPFAAIAALFVITTLSRSQEPFDWEKYDYAHKLIPAKGLDKLDLDTLGFIRGIIFGKHGRIFKSSLIQEYLDDTDWYKRKKTFKNSELNDVERRNLDIVREEEAHEHSEVQPGDLR